MIKRRDFIKSFVRGSVLTGLSTITGIGIYRHKTFNENCDYDFVCRICKKRRSCSLPEAVDFRTTNNMN